MAALAGWLPQPLPPPFHPVTHCVRGAPLRVVAVSNEEVVGAGDEAHVSHLHLNGPLQRRLLQQGGYASGRGGTVTGGLVAGDTEASSGVAAAVGKVVQQATWGRDARKDGSGGVLLPKQASSSTAPAHSSSKLRGSPLLAQAGGPAAARRAAPRPPWAWPHSCAGGGRHGGTCVGLTSTTDGERVQDAQRACIRLAHPGH